MRVTIYNFFLCLLIIYTYTCFSTYAHAKGGFQKTTERSTYYEQEKKIEGNKEIYTQKKKTTVRTEEVVVSATKVDKGLLDVPASVGIVRQEDIQRSGAKTIGDALKDIPGVELTSDGTQGLKRITIRGEKTSGTLILIDGQRIVENKSVEGTPILIDPSRIERIEVIKGPSSVLYGADAMGGVVNIITKKGGKKPIEGEVFVGFNSNTFGFNEGLSLFGGHNGFTYRASITQNDQGNLTTPAGRVPNTRYSNTDASLYLDYSFLNKYTVGIGYDYYHANIRGTIEPRSLSGTLYNEFEANIPDWTRHKINTFFLAKDITDYLSRIRVDFFVQETTKDFDNIIDTDINTPINLFINPRILTNSQNINQQIGLSVQTDWLLGNSTLLIVGYDFAYDWLDTDGDIFGTLSIPPNPPHIQRHRSMTYTAKGYSITNALYAQGETSLPQDFILNYGTRLSIITTGMDSYSGNTLNRFFQPISIVTNAKEKTYIQPVFSFGAMYTGIEDTTFRLSFAQGFRSPTLQERFINASAAGEIIYANPTIKPESSYTVEFGTRYFANNFRIEITPFYTFTENYILAQPVPGMTSSAEYKNIGKAHTVGIEGDLRYTISMVDLTPYTSFTFIKRQFDYGAFKTWSTGTPEISGRFGILYETDAFEEYGFTFYADIFGSYGSSATYTQPDGSGRQTLHVDSYITANIHTGLRFGSKKQYYLDVMANNIFNKKYISPVAVRQVGAGYLYEPGTYVAMQIGARF